MPGSSFPIELIISTPLHTLILCPLSCASIDEIQEDANSYVILFLSFQKSACGGDLSLQLIHFENPQSKLDNGKCCDDLGEICSQCEYRFTFCLSRLTTDNCTFKRISTPVLTSDEYYIFQSRFKSVKPSEIITNPMIIPVERWDVSLL